MSEIQRFSVAASLCEARVFVFHATVRAAHRAAATGLLVLSVSLLLLALPVSAATKVLEETIEQKYSLDPNATLSISNTDGSIRIYAAETSEILIQATKKAYTAERLKGIVVDVQATRHDPALLMAASPRASIAKPLRARLSIWSTMR